MAAGLGIGWGINWGSIALSAKAVLDYLTFKLNFNTIATDFTFTRNSFATRVNEFGLIETVTNLGNNLVQNGNFEELGAEQVSNGNFALGSEIVTNGNFDDGENNWDFGGDWTLVNGTAEILTSLNSFLIQSNIIPLTVKTYKIQYEVVTTNGSNFRFAGGNSAFGSVTLDSATVGVKTVYLTSNGTAANLQFNQNSFRGSIDNISLKEVTDWDLDSSWSVSDEKATYDASLNGQEIRQFMSSIAVGKTVKIQFDILDVEATKDAYFKLDCSGTPESIFPYTKFSEGTYTYYHTITSGLDRLNFTALNSSTGGAFSITNVSLKQVDPNDDWTLNNTVWQIANDIATADGTANGNMQQIGVVPSGTSGTYTFSWTQEITSGTRFRIFQRNGANTSGSGVTFVSGSTTGSGSFNTGGNCVGSGTFTVTVDTTDGFTVWFIAESGNEGTIDNVSVVEVITDDIPRIDFTGSTFDVPVLGEELVTNGSFDTDANWVKQSGWSIANGVATFDKNNYSGGSSNLYQTIMTVGKEYVATFDIVDYVEGNFRILGVSGLWNTNGTHSVKFTASFSQLYLNVNPASNTILSIDNVSVKEVTAYTTEDKGAFLLEPISTNSLIYSEDLSSWQTFGSPIRTGGQDDLSGGTSAYKVEFPSANDFIRLLGVNTVGTFTMSVYAKKSIGDTFYFNVDGNIGNYNFSTESFTAGTGSPTGDMIDFGNGWYKCTMTFSSTNTNTQVRIQSNSGSTVILWGAQLEALPYATSYIPTNGATVTRAQESCIDATPTINSEEGVLYAEISALSDDSTRRCISLSNGSTSNRVMLRYDSVSNRIQCFAQIGGTVYADISTTSYDTTDINKVAFRYKSGEYALYINGVEQGTSADITIFPQNTLTELSFRRGDNNGSQDFYGRTKDLRVYDKALTDAQLTELTTI
jgi:hypothetical protein